MKAAIIKLLVLTLVLGQLGINTAWAQEPTTYIVQQGDTLSEIALRYGMGVEAIVQANAISDPDLILVGQRLVIPSIAGRIHIVRWGETLSLIALRHGTSVEALVRANGIANPDLIFIGQRLIIPTSLPFTAVEVRPSPAVQGQTLVIEVRMGGDMALKGSFDGRPLAFVEEEGHRWALAGIPAWAEPGLHFIELEADGAQATRAVLVAAGKFPIEYIRLSTGVRKLLDPALLRAERDRMAEVFAAFSPEKRWRGLFAVPVQGRITSPFGARRSYNGGPVRSYHGGVDYGAPEGTPVYAAEAGEVVLAEELKVRGKIVVIGHGLGVMSGYWHLSDIAVRVGQEVGKGDLIGRVGSTGLSTGPHLHWEVRVGGVQVDPLQWTKQRMP